MHYSVLVTFFTLAAAHNSHLGVPKLDQKKFNEAQRYDYGATRAFKNIRIKTQDGRCLWVDPLSGDDRANRTPVQIGSCGGTQGQGWDIITHGKHNNRNHKILIVSTLTRACFNFDPRANPKDAINLFSCGGIADGSGTVTDSQLFDYDASDGTGPLQFKTTDGDNQCLRTHGNRVVAPTCDQRDSHQFFYFDSHKFEKRMQEHEEEKENEKRRDVKKHEDGKKHRDEKKNRFEGDKRKREGCKKEH